MKVKLSSFFCLLLVILFSFNTLAPLFHPGFFPMHDDTQPSRVFEMSQALSAGQFPVRWVADLGYGYGYPIFNFYAPLPYYLGALFNIAGFDVITATKIMFALGIIMAAVTMFFLIINITGEVAATVGSLLYMYAPYHAVDIYVRGAVGELYAMVFLPLVILGVIKIIKISHSRVNPVRESENLLKIRFPIKSGMTGGIAIGSIGLAGVLISHNIIGMISGYFLALGLIIYFIYLILSRKKLSVICYLLSVICIGIGLSAFFTLPAILEKGFTRVDELTSGTNNFANHFVYPDQLWSSPWGYAGSAPGRLDGMSFMIGKIHLLLALLAIPIVVILHKRKRINNFQFSIFNFQLLLLIITIFLMLDISKPIWDLLPGFSFIQYPWRFLLFSSLSISIIVVAVLGMLKKSWQIVLAIIIIIPVVWFNSRYFVVQEYLSVKPDDYTSRENLRFQISKISDEYLPQDFIIPQSPQGIALQAIEDRQDLKVINFAETPTQKTYKVEVYAPIFLQTNITYFPGWQVIIDNLPTVISSTDGRIGFTLSSGIHDIEIILRDTPVRFVSNLIAIASLFLVVYIIVL